MKLKYPSVGLGLLKFHLQGMKSLTLFILLSLSSLAQADKYRDELKNRDLGRDLKFKEGYSNYREEYTGFEQNALEERPAAINTASEEEEDAPMAVRSNLPPGVPGIPGYENLTKEQATELGRSIKKAQEQGLPNIPSLTPNTQK